MLGIENFITARHLVTLTATQKGQICVFFTLNVHMCGTFFELPTNMVKLIFGESLTCKCSGT